MVIFCTEIVSFCRPGHIHIKTQLSQHFLQKVGNNLVINYVMVQLRCNFTLALERFTHTREQLTHTHIELLMMSVLLPTRNSHKIMIWSSGVVSDTVTHVNLGYYVIDHHNIHKLVLELVLELVSCSQNLCHRALIH